MARAGIDGKIGAVPNPPRQTLIAPATTGQATDGLLVATWLRSKRSPNTRAAYAADLNRLQAYLPAHKPLRAVTLLDLQEFADSIAELKPNYQVRILGSIRSLFRFACRTGYLQLDPSSAVPLPPRPATLPKRILTVEEVARILEAAKSAGPLMRVLVRFLYATAVRLTEARLLTWADLEPRESRTGQITIMAKGGKARTLKLPVTAWSDVLALGRGKPTDLVFPIPARTVRYHLARLAKQARISKPVSPHWLRHAHASHAIEAGCPLPLVQAQLGHERIATTGLYLHARPGDTSARFLTLLGGAKRVPQP